MRELAHTVLNDLKTAAIQEVKSYLTAGLSDVLGDFPKMLAAAKDIVGNARSVEDIGKGIEDLTRTMLVDELRDGLKNILPGALQDVMQVAQTLVSAASITASELGHVLAATAEQGVSALGKVGAAAALSSELRKISPSAAAEIMKSAPALFNVTQGSNLTLNDHVTVDLSTLTFGRNVSIDFLSPAAGLHLSGTQLRDGGPTLFHFGLGDSLHITDILKEGITAQYSSLTGKLNLTHGSATVATVVFDNKTLGLGSFHTGSDDKGFLIVSHS